MNTKLRVSVSLDNLSPREHWALQELIALFSDPAHAATLQDWLEGIVALRLDPETGRIQTEMAYEQNPHHLN